MMLELGLIRSQRSRVLPLAQWTFDLITCTQKCVGVRLGFEFALQLQYVSEKPRVVLV
jgi:hypothetical protein